jgi:hypothetical protein
MGLQIISFDDCVEKIENVGNTVRVQGALDLLRELETEKHMPREEGHAEHAARSLSDEMEEEVPGEGGAGSIELAGSEETGSSDKAEAAAAGAQISQLEVADGMDADEEDFPNPEDFEDEDIDVGAEYADMVEDDDLFSSAAPAASARPAPAPAPSAMPELSKEQQDRIERNRQAARQVRLVRILYARFWSIRPNVCQLVNWRYQCSSPGDAHQPCRSWSCAAPGGA